MRLDSGQISGTRFMFTITFFLQASALLTSFIAGVTKQSSWMTVLLGMVVGIPIIWLYRTLMAMFPDKNLIQLLEHIFGTVAGKILGVGYLWFFVTLTALNLGDLGDFAKISIMTETPHSALTLLCVLVTAMAVSCGIRVVTRYAAFFTVLEFLIIAFSIVLALNQIKPQNLLPLWNVPLRKMLQGTHIILTIPLGELVTFLMITPNLKATPRDLTKFWFLGVGMGMLTVLVIMLRDITVLGNTLHLFTLPGLETLRLVSLGEALSRMEILFAAALIMLLFFKVTFLCYISVIALAQLMRARGFKHLALLMGMLAVAYGLTLYPNPVEHTRSAREITPVIWTAFEILIPLVTLITAKVRGLPRQKPEIPEQSEG